MSSEFFSAKGDCVDVKIGLRQQIEVSCNFYSDIPFSNTLTAVSRRVGAPAVSITQVACQDFCNQYMGRISKVNQSFKMFEDKKEASVMCYFGLGCSSM